MVGVVKLRVIIGFRVYATDIQPMLNLKSKALSPAAEGHSALSIQVCPTA